jgi:signal transduction histidine kinase
MKEDTHKLLENIAFRASHNIRGPLARIRGLSDLIRRDLLAPDEFKMIAERLTICSDELSVATTELVCFVHDHQELIREKLTNPDDELKKTSVSADLNGTPKTTSDSSPYK